ncbi:hypothetical protein BGZ49_007333 [Haplosporangium sp. Z 27]|nr:hypothetical protein BGZ49_007333 [Haplosporangium sp. Z 27]
MAEKARERAFLRMLEHAAAAGGNAVIGVQFTGQEIVQPTKKLILMTEVMSYGTAVTLVPLQQSQPQSPQPTGFTSSPFSQPPQQAFTPQQTYAAAPGQPVYSAPGQPVYSAAPPGQQAYAAPPVQQAYGAPGQQYASPPPTKN